MSIDSALSSLGSITTTIGSASNTASRIAADLGGARGVASSASWSGQLRPASFRGVPFAVLGGTSKFGRRNAVHEYPFKEKNAAWVEDVGRAARHINVSGFLVGDDVIAQRERMIAAVETPGAGALIHPTLGRLNVSTIDFSTEERWDQGRVFQLTFAFIEAGQRVFPSVETSTGSAVKSACKAADAAASTDFASTVAASLKQGASIVAQAAGTAAAWGRQAQRYANDATNLYHMVGTLKGSLGRYAGGAGIGKFATSAGALASAGSTVPKLLALGAAARTAVSGAVDKLTSTASELGS
jgi:prophage DNA circulation protein